MVEVPDSMGTAIVAAIGLIIAQIVTGAFTWLQSWQNTKHIKAVDHKVIQVAAEQKETKHELNSRLTELVEAVRVAARADGILEGIEQQKRRTLTGDQGTPDVTK